MSHIYVIEFSCGLIKVGKTRNPKSRISTHASTVRIVSGAEISREWVSIAHTNNSENELKLINFCSSKFGNGKSKGREWFNGCSFDEVVIYAEKLEYSQDFLEKNAADEESTRLFLDKFGTVEQKNEQIKSSISYECAIKLENFIRDSLWVGGDLFEVNDKFGMSPFVIVVGAYFYGGDPVELLIEAMSQILMCDENQAATVNIFYREAYSSISKLWGDK